MNGPGGGSGKRTSSPGVPTPGEAVEALSAVRGALRGGRRAAVGEITRVPLVVWGVVWCADYAALEFLSGAVAAPLAAGLAAVAFGLSRRAGGEAQASSGWEVEVVGAWWVLLVGSVALALVVGPGSEVVLGLMLGAFWGIALMLYAVVAKDRALGALGVGIVILAVALRVASPPLALLLFGLVSGASMAGLGMVRWVKPSSRAPDGSQDRGDAVGGG